MECNLSFLKHPNQLTWPRSFPNKPCAASSTFSAKTTKLAALWFAGEPWELYFIIRHSLAYRENCLEYLKLSIVEVHFISVPASVGDLKHGLYIKMLPEAEKYMNKMNTMAKESNSFKTPHISFQI